MYRTPGARYLRIAAALVLLVVAIRSAREGEPIRAMAMGCIASVFVLLAIETRPQWTHLKSAALALIAVAFALLAYRFFG